jgi:hypothetical protein
MQHLMLDDRQHLLDLVEASGSAFELVYPAGGR